MCWPPASKGAASGKPHAQTTYRWQDSWKVPGLIICRTSEKKVAQRHQQLSGGEETSGTSDHTIGCLSHPIMGKVGYWRAKNDNVCQAKW